MILVLGGTAEAREIALALQARGREVLLTTVSAYGGELAGAVPVRVGELSREELAELVARADAVVDATHPFAAVISRLAVEICAACGTPYLRFERPESALPPHVLLAEDAPTAAQLAVRTVQGGTIFLTVGSKTLPVYLEAARTTGCRVVARVLPTAGVLAECERLGLPPRDLLAMQGPTTAEVDAVLLRFYQARVLVTKESGPTGGVPEKLAAAEAVGIPVIVVGRPRVEYPCVVSTVDEAVNASQNHHNQR